MPDPETPVTHTKQLSGILTLIFFKLFCSAPFISRNEPLLIFLFFGISIFKSYKENPVPSSTSIRLIKTGIFAYTRNPIYVSFVLFHLSMFLVFENIMYFLTSISLAFWIHNYVIKPEEDYLLEIFSDEYKRYMEAVSRWVFF